MILSARLADTRSNTTKELDSRHVDTEGCKTTANFFKILNFTIFTNFSHYTCSYLGIICGICGASLVFDVNQNEHEFLSFEMNTKREEEDPISNNSEALNLLLEIKNMLIEQRTDQAKQLKMIEELKEDMKEHKRKDEILQSLQADIISLKHDKITKDIKELQEKVEKLAADALSP